MREEDKVKIMESWLEQLEHCKKEQTGVCCAIALVHCNGISSDEELEIDNVLETALAEWAGKHGSGSAVFPVPARIIDELDKDGDARENAMYAYQPGSQRMWNPTTYYGRKRRELANHLTKTLEAHLETCIEAQDNE